MSKLVKICPSCGTKWPETTPACRNDRCKADLFNARIVDEEETPVSPPPVPGVPARLLLATGGQEFVCKDGDVLGREGSVAVAAFQNIGEVSRRHVSVSLQDGQWFLSVLPNVPNLTELDGVRLTPGAPQALKGEHRLRLSTKCEVRLRVAVP
jgi:hypothetical protein